MTGDFKSIMSFIDLIGVPGWNVVPQALVVEGKLVLDGSGCRIGAGVGPGKSGLWVMWKWMLEAEEKISTECWQKRIIKHCSYEKCDRWSILNFLKFRFLIYVFLDFYHL